MNRSLTLLQHGVIERLQEAGFHAVAELADEHWTAGERVPGDVRPGTERTRYGDLVADFVRANEQARDTA